MCRAGFGPAKALSAGDGLNSGADVATRVDADADHPIVLFDGVCNLCNGFVQFVIERDPDAQFRFGALQSEAGQAHLGQFDLATSDFETFVLIRGEEYATKSTAALLVCWELGLPWSLLYAAIAVPKPLRDLVYDLVASTRYDLWGRRDQCMRPTPEIEDRFLAGTDPVVGQDE